MTAEELREMALKGERPAQMDLAIECLWLEASGDWDGAHDISESIPSPLGENIHAYLHRQEGDYWNACYWYQRAGVKAPAEKADFTTEWLALAKKALASAS